MVAYITEGSGRPEVRRIGTLPLLAAPMPAEGFLAPWRRRLRWRRLRRRGIRRAVMPAALEAEAAEERILPVPVWPLRQALLPQLLGERRGTLAELRAPWVTPAVTEAAWLLARRFRYVRLSVGRGGEALAEALLCRWGLCAGGSGTPELTVSFAGPPETAEELCLGEDCRRWQRICYEPVAALAGMEQPEALLCLLWQAGMVKKEEIRLKSIVPNA